MNQKIIIGLVMIGVVLMVAGCGSGTKMRTFLRPEASLAHIQAVAVLPFEGDDSAPRIREFTMTQVLATDLFDVIDKGRVDSFLAQEAITPGTPLDSTTLRRMGQIVKVEAFILGSVAENTDTRGNANYTEITLTLRLIDAETGILLWQASGLGSGYSLTDRLFGMAPKNNFEVTMNLLNRLLATLR